MNYSFDTEHSIETSKMVVGSHLTKRGVKYRENVNELESESTPLPIFSFDSRLYSRDNWIGINPFQFISWVNIHFRQDEGNKTKISIEFSMMRVLYFMIFFSICALSMLSASFTAGIVGFCFAGFIGIVCYFMATKFVLEEIMNALLKANV